MKNNEKSHFIDKVVEALRKSAVEMEEFQVKIALGKAEAEDKYEEIKKKFNLFIHDSKYKIKVGKEKVDDLNFKFEKLMVQLKVEKAQTIETFRNQKEQLLTTIKEIEEKIRANETLNKVYAFMLIEFEKFKVQLELLEQKYEQGKENASLTFEKGKVEFNRFIERMKAKYSKKKEETRWEHFQNEISEGFSHFKEAFIMPQH